VDQDGLPARLCVTEGQASDKTVALALIPGLPASEALVGDRGYDAQGMIAAAQANGTPACIPTQRDRKAQRTVPRDIYARRNLVEGSFNRMKHSRRAATRYDKLARNYLAAIALVSTRLWCRHVESTA
jgi:transposase